MAMREVLAAMGVRDIDTTRDVTVFAGRVENPL
jgi:hypothetical protein